MNETVKKGYEMAKETGDFEVDYLPEVEDGEILELNDVWDGEKKENPLDTLVKITKIELI